MKYLACFALLIIVLAVEYAGAQTTQSTPQSPKLLLISIDGLRPDVLLRAKTPHIRSLMDRGVFSLWARTTPLSTTLPSHVSMLTGAVPRRHQIEWNKDIPLSEPVYPSIPSIFDLGHKQGLRVAMAVGKSKFDCLARPGMVDAMYIPATSKTTDVDVAQEAAKIIVSTQPDFMFVHFPGVDNVGHSKGWGTSEQLAALEKIDLAVDQVLDAYRKLGWIDSMYILITADHGGAGITHGPEDPRSRHIPWILVGPNVRKNYDLTRFQKLTIDTEDTFATACEILKIKYTHTVDGKVIKEAFDNQELLQAK